MTEESADWLLAALIGAQVVSIARCDFETFDHVVSEVMRTRGQVVAPAEPVAA